MQEILDARRQGGEHLADLVGTAELMNALKIRLMEQMPDAEVSVHG